MALTPAERREIWARFQQDESRLRKSIKVDKGDLRAAVDAMDDWWDTVKVSGNQAIPQPARSALTARQKKYIFLLLMQTIFNLDVGA